MLLSDGKYYGHLEIAVIYNSRGLWDVTITPADAFPLLSAEEPGVILSWERRTYDDVVTFTAVPEPSAIVLALVAIAAGIGIRGRRCCSRAQPVPQGE